MYYFICCIAVVLLLVIGCRKKHNETSRINSPASQIMSSFSDANEPVLVIDVRTEKEYSSGHFKEAVNIPYTEIANKIQNYTADKNQKILLYCLSGSRSNTALNTLENLGYTNVTNIGGFEDAKAYFKSIQQN